MSLEFFFVEESFEISGELACVKIKGAIAEYPAQRVVFDSTATVVRGPQSVSKVKCMCQVLN